MTRRPPSRRTLKVPPSPIAGGNIATSFRWVWYGISLAVPFAGILIALFLYDRDDREVRKVGRTCLLVGFIVWVVLPALVIAGTLLLIALTAFSWISNFLPAAE